MKTEKKKSEKFIPEVLLDCLVDALHRILRQIARGAKRRHPRRKDKEDLPHLEEGRMG